MEHPKRIGTKLYKVYSTIDDWPHRAERYNGVSVTWYVREREEPPVPYEEAIEAPDRVSHIYLQSLLDGLFTEKELSMFRKYLAEKHGNKVSAKVVELPLTGCEMAVWDLPLDSRRNIHLLDEEECYDLPFKVGGWYDISNSVEYQTPRAEEKTGPYIVVPIQSASSETETELKDVRLVIKGNNASVREGCKVCGGEVEGRIPYEVFAMGTWRPVCPECVEKIDPVLGRLLDHFYDSKSLHNLYYGIKHAFQELEVDMPF